jgi:hypothetical protein
MSAHSPVSEYTFSEAPASVTIRFILDGYDCMLTLRDIAGQAALTRLQGAMTVLAAMGAAPRARDYEQHAAREYEQGVTHPNGNGTPPPAQDAFNRIAPKCPRHGIEMKPSKFGGWYCGEKVGTNPNTGKTTFCDQKIK